MKYIIDNPIEPQNVFNQLMEMGNLSYSQMFETFNMGMGYVVIINANSKSDFTDILRNKVPFKEIGYVEEGTGIEVQKFSINFSDYY